MIVSFPEGEFAVEREAVTTEVVGFDSSLIFEQDPVQILDALLPLYMNSQVCNAAVVAVIIMILAINTVLCCCRRFFALCKSPSPLSLLPE